MSDAVPPPAEKPPQVVRIFLESRYQKLVRDLPQTIFWCPQCQGRWRKRRDCEKCGGFGKLSKDSVQELIARTLQPLFKARKCYFHGAGREDVDVRMLGAGRPFVFELYRVQATDVDVATLHAAVNLANQGRIAVAPFTVVPRSRVPFWKEGLFQKRYGARVEAEAPIDLPRLAGLVGQTFTVEQRTPQRVVHRRADIARTREVTVTRAEPIDVRHCRLELLCAHGTYVKEWISGDQGRTHPGLADLLGVPCRCEELDVLEILTDQAAPSRARSG